MKIKNANLEWNVLDYDWNSKRVEPCNVLGRGFVEELHKKIRTKKVTNYEELKDFIDRYFMYHYWSKAEWEIVVGGLFTKEPDLTKIDAYTQLKMNLDRIVDYVNNELRIGFKKKG